MHLLNLLIVKEMPDCRCFGSPAGKFLVCASGPDGVLGGHKNLYWFGRNVATSSPLLLVLSALVCSRGNKRAREGAGPKSLVNGSKGVESHSTPFPSPVMGHSTSPFIDEGKAHVT